ncbi:MAG: hypothetical protein LBS90_05975 [Oscillospiraceae bacterium]|jgi:hypothetical protein|nr:hypothetical protein [Oscillospiraceae bacterium]
MLLFWYELKKLWNLKVLLLIGALAALAYFAILRFEINQYNSEHSYGMFGEYQYEMYTRYGDSLSPAEYEDFDVPGKIAEQIAVLDGIIASEPTFAKYGITCYEDYDRVIGELTNSYMTDTGRGFQTVFPPEVDYDLGVIAVAISYTPPGAEDENQHHINVPTIMLLQQLHTVEYYYGTDGVALTYTYDERPVVARRAQKLLAQPEKSLLDYHFSSEFSTYAAYTAVFAAVVSLLPVALFITTDRARRVRALQYPSKTGRRVFRTQFFACAVSSLAIAAATICASYALFFAQSGAAKLLGFDMMLCGGTFFLYNITVGEYVAVLAGMTAALCVGSACFAFVLGRFSSDIVSLLLKAVPVGAAAGFIAMYAVMHALSERNWIFSYPFNGRIDAAEVLTAAAFMLLGLAAAGLVIRREQRAEEI